MLTFAQFRHGCYVRRKILLSCQMFQPHPQGRLAPLDIPSRHIGLEAFGDLQGELVHTGNL